MLVWVVSNIFEISFFAAHYHDNKISNLSNVHNGVGIIAVHLKEDESLLARRHVSRATRVRAQIRLELASECFVVLHQLVLIA
jgi:hypothetical protein